MFHHVQCRCVHKHPDTLTKPQRQYRLCTTSTRRVSSPVPSEGSLLSYPCTLLVAAISIHPTLHSSPPFGPLHPNPTSLHKPLLAVQPLTHRIRNQAHIRLPRIIIYPLAHLGNQNVPQPPSLMRR